MKDDGIEREQPDFEVRTDLAVEERESFPGDGGEISGVSLREWEQETAGLRMTEVRILNSQGAEAMGKPEGVYLTLEANGLYRKGQEDRKHISRELARQLARLMERMLPPGEGSRRILAVGLGNQMVTADALGPKTVGNLSVTRHLGEKQASGTRLSALVPGVMAQTGMETAEILKGVVEETKPELLVVIDALAARSAGRLGTTIQLTDTGIHPGSGVGNHRHGLTKESLGVPVLAIGVPTVVGAAAIALDTVGAMIQALRQSSAGFAAEEMERMTPEEQYQLIRELLEPEFGALYVTPPNIDEIVEQISGILAEGIQQAAGVLQ